MNLIFPFKPAERLSHEIIRDLNLEGELAEIVAIHEGMPGNEMHAIGTSEAGGSRRWIQFVSFFKCA